MLVNEARKSIDSEDFLYSECRQRLQELMIHYRWHNGAKEVAKKVIIE
jgi:hypothetical protein